MIRAARPEEIKLLPQIENAADSRFRRVGLELVFRMPCHSLAVLREGRRHGLLWVAVTPTNRPVGFLLMHIAAGIAWIEQLSVLDHWQGRGLGTALIDRAEAAAHAYGYPVLHLTTYRTVAWNKPFYARRGFVELGRGDLTRAMRVVLVTEVRHGHPVWQRAVMRR